MSADLLNINSVKQAYAAAKVETITAEQLELFRREWLGKQGKLKELFKVLAKLPQEEKAEFALEINNIKNDLELFIDQKNSEFENLKLLEKLKSESLDLSLPGKNVGTGTIHPIRMLEQKITEILKPFGFNIVEGPEVETEYFCFDALNIPKHHPARDMQDTFYTEDGRVLRTHTTSVQARVLSKKQLPVKVISAGRVYRNETEDTSHQAMFHQYELVWIDEGLKLSNLVALLDLVLKGLYGTERKVRFVPKFYPYTEPSIGGQIDCAICQAQGCGACGGSGWVTIVGAGMVHHKVLEEFGYDPEKVSGLAFGFGTSRLAAQFYEAANLKSLYDGDLRYLGALR